MYHPQSIFDYKETKNIADYASILHIWYTGHFLKQFTRAARKQHNQGLVPWGAGCALAPPDFGRLVNPIQTRGQIMPLLLGLK